MNAYNQRRNQNPDSQYINRYNKSDDTFSLLVKKYSSKVENEIVTILQKDKKMSEDDAHKFMINLFSLDKKRNKDQRKEIENCYINGKTVDECAKELLDKYYKITVVNKYQNTNKFQTNRELSGEGEITEVTENKYNKYIYHNLASFSQFIDNELITNDKFKIDEKINYKDYKKVSKSLLFNFLNKINKLGLKFKLNTTYVKNVTNSLNDKTYVLFLETDNINNREIKEIFKYGNILSNILNYLKDVDYDSVSKFYIGIDSNSNIHFGMIFNNMKYKIGYTKYTSYDFKKIISLIQSDKQIDLEKLSNKIVSILYSINNAKKVFDLHLDKYDEDIDLYIGIVDNKFNIIIETIDDDILTLKYIEDMVKNYVKFSQFTEWELNKEKKSNKTIYYFTLK